MTVKCPKHAVFMTHKEGVSKKGNKYSLYKCPAAGCEEIMWDTDFTSKTKGDEMETQQKEGADTSMKDTLQFEEEAEKDYSGKVDEAVKDFTNESKSDDESPMTNKKWNIKSFEKSWGVFSSPARNEGMSPNEAIEKMHLWDWLDSVHKGTVGYEKWKGDVMERVENQEK